MVRDCWYWIAGIGLTRPRFSRRVSLLVELTASSSAFFTGRPSAISCSDTPSPKESLMTLLRANTKSASPAGTAPNQEARSEEARSEEARSEETSSEEATWHSTACILCESNCGVEVRLGGPSQHGDSRGFTRIRGDKAHPASKGYTCEKALRLDHYQNGTARITSPLRRKSDGTYEEIDWDTAIREIAAGFTNVRDTHGGETIFYFGGGGQGNHLGGAYSGATLRALGAKFKANALSQEKTGEFWVNDKMMGGGTRGDFENCEVALFVGKNPWQSHGFSHARTTLKEIAKDPARSIIVIDPRRSETAELADIHLQVKPGTDAWCLASLVGIIVQENLLDNTWVAEHTTGVAEVVQIGLSIDVSKYADICGVDEQVLREAARTIAKANSVAVFEDLGIQMSPNSTLCSYLEKLVWMLTGNFGKPGTQYMPSSLVALARGGEGNKPGQKSGGGAVSPVVGARIISGLIPCNVITDEILTDHPNRYRAMLVESGNPAHSLADSQRMREALSSLELLVVIDVAMTETARLAHYVLPAASQYEKYEATFFNFEFPKNVFHLRRPLLDPLPGTLPEPEIHARLVEALGVLTDSDYAPLRQAATVGREAYAAAFFAATTADPKLGAYAPILLYRTLGPTLPNGAASAAILWGASHRCAMGFPESVARAGYTGDGLEPGEKLFEAILNSPSGVDFTVDEWEDCWRRVKTPDGRLNLVIDELLSDVAALEHGVTPAPDGFPLILSAGERRSFTANTIFRDNTWRKKDSDGALRISVADAELIGLIDGGKATLTTQRASVNVLIEVSPMMRQGHISLPNGMGVGTSDDVTGIAPNELTASGDRDRIAGTPFHKHVHARLEPVSA
jgi:anaerobic selenocysteine-containing dehydrogenase